MKSLLALLLAVNASAGNEALSELAAAAAPSRVDVSAGALAAAVRGISPDAARPQAAAASAAVVPLSKSKRLRNAVMAGLVGAAAGGSIGALVGKAGGGSASAGAKGGATYFGALGAVSTLAIR